MICSDNSLTQASGLSANDAGVSYTLNFDYGTANYANEVQGTPVSDALIVEFLRGDDTVLATQTYAPGGLGHRQLQFRRWR